MPETKFVEELAFGRCVEHAGRVLMVRLLEHPKPTQDPQRELVLLVFGEPVEVRGYLDSSNQVLAVEVKELSSSGDKIIRGPVTNKLSNTLTILGVDILLTGSTVLQDGAITNMSQFLALVTAAPPPGGTVVKAKGLFAGGTLTANEAEIED